MAGLTIQQVREKFPAYGDLSDQALADALHRKFYADMPREEFDRRIGYAPVPPAAADVTQPPAPSPETGPRYTPAPVADATRMPPQPLQPEARPMQGTPFDGETPGQLAERRGQEVIAGTVDVFASVPEAAALVGTSIESNVTEAAKQRAPEIAAEAAQIEATLASGQPMTEGQRRVLTERLALLRESTPAQQTASQFEVRPASERALFKAGDDLRAFSERIVGKAPRDDSFWSMVATGGGNLIGLASGALITGPAAPLTGGTLAANQMAASTYKEAKAKGASEDDALRAAGLASLVGATDIIPLARALRPLEGVAPELVVAVAARIRKALASGGEEAAQEAIQGVLGNLIAQGIYDPERGLLDGVTEQALAGAVLGSLAGTVGGLVPGERPAKPTEPTPVDRAQALAAGIEAATIPPGRPQPPMEDTANVATVPAPATRPAQAPGVSFGLLPEQRPAEQTSTIGQMVIAELKKRGVMQDKPPSADTTSAAAPRAQPEQLLRFIGSLEAPEGYDQVFSGVTKQPPRPITSMTIDEVIQWQRDAVAAGSKSSAAGQYQIIRKTLEGLKAKMGLTGTEKFDQAMQDAMAVELMRGRGLDDFLAGKLSAEDFADRLALEWAALPNRKNKSAYDGDGLNKALTSRDAFMAVLQGQDVKLPERPERSAPPISPVSAAPQAPQAAPDAPGVPPTQPGPSAPATGLPVPAEALPKRMAEPLPFKAGPPAKPAGVPDTVTTPAGEVAQVEYRVVDAAELRTDVSAFQNRDTSRDGRQARVAEYAANLDPAQIMPWPNATAGTPVVGRDGIVEAGNTRTLAVLRAAQMHPEKMRAYVEAIRARGFDVPEGMRVPMLAAVRVDTPPEAARIRFADTSNAPITAQLSPAERALNDARNMTPAIMSWFRPDEAPDSRSNREAVRRFVMSLPDTERAAVTGKDGAPNTEAARRARAAMFARAYKDEALVDFATEEDTAAMKSIVDALVMASPRWSEMQDALAADPSLIDRNPNDVLLAAFAMVKKARADARQQGRPVAQVLAEAVAQDDIFAGQTPPEVAAMVRAMFRSDAYTQARGASSFAAILNSVAKAVVSARDAAQGMLRPTRKPRAEEVIREARETEDGGQGSLFGDGSKPSPAPAARPAPAEDRGRPQQAEGPADKTDTTDKTPAPVAPKPPRKPKAEPDTLASRAPKAAPAADTQEEGDADTLDFSPGPRYVPTLHNKSIPRPASGTVSIAGRTVLLPSPDAPVRRDNVRRDMIAVMGPRLYQGKVKGKMRAGFYRVRQGEVRLRNYDDLEILAHEFAHWMDFHSKNRRRWTNLRNDPQFASELAGITYDKTKPKIEGWAEFIRLWFTQADMAVSAAPKLFAAFEAELAQLPQLQARMRRMQEDMHRWYNQGPLAQLRASRGQDMPVRQQIAKAMEDVALARQRQRLIDRYHGAKVVERTTRGRIVEGAQSASKLYQLAAGGWEHVVEGVLENGTPTIAADGGLTFSGKGLLDVLKPVMKSSTEFEAWTDYAVARRGEELMAQGRENLLTSDRIKAGLAQAQGRPHFADVFKEYQAFNRRMLDFYVQSSLITPDQKKAFETQNANYLPFYRIVESVEDGGTDGGTSIGMRLVGGEQNIGDVAVNMVESIAQNVRAAMLARAKSRMYADIMASDDGALFASILAPDSEPVRVMLNELAGTVEKVMAGTGIGISANGLLVANRNAAQVVDRKDIEALLQRNPELMTFWLHNRPPKTTETYVDSAILNGERKFFEVRDRMLVEMLTQQNLARPQSAPTAFAWSLAQWVKRFQSRAITGALQFLPGNLFRDTMSAATLSKRPFVPIYSSLRGMVHYALDTRTMKEFRINGGGYAARQEAVTAETRARARLQLMPPPLTKEPLNRAGYELARTLAKWDRIVSAFEYGTRLGQYELARKAGADAVQAAWEAREISTDFAKRGSDATVQVLSSITPFLNASIQGLDREAREIFDIKGKMTLANAVKFDRAKAIFVAKGLFFVSAATVALWLKNHQEDWYNDLTDDERARFWWWSPTVKFPKPFGIGHLFGTVPEAMMEWAFGQGGDRMAGLLGFAAYQTFIDPFTSGPGIIRPSLEAAMNRDWKGTPIIPRGLENAPAPLQYTERTPQLYVELGQHLGLSPVLAQHYVRGFLGYHADYIRDASEAMLWRSDQWGERPFATSPLVDYPLHSFTGKEVPARTLYTEGYWELRDRADGIKAALDQAMKMRARNPKGPEALLASRVNATLAEIEPQFSRMQKTLSGITASVVAIKYDPTLSAAQKEEQINALYREKNTLLRNLYQTLSARIAEAEKETSP